MTAKRSFPLNKPLWIDFDPARQREARNAIASLALPGAVDELGIGVFRDSISNILFPGTTVTMTRAVYLALLPSFMYQAEYKVWKLANEQKNTNLTAVYYNTMQELQKKFCKKHRDHSGIIGNTKEGEVQRAPWSIYWNALLLWDLIPPISHHGQEIQQLSAYVRHVCDMIKEFPDRKQLTERWADFKHYHPESEIDLLPDEQRFISEKLTQGDSLLALLSRVSTETVHFRNLNVPADFQETEIWKDAVFFNIFMKTAFAGYNLLLNVTKNNIQTFEETVQKLKTSYPSATAHERLTSVFSRNQNSVYNKRKVILRNWLSSCYDTKPDFRLIVEEESVCKGENKANCAVFNRHEVGELNYDSIREILPPDHNKKWVGMKDLDYRCYESTRLINHLTSGKYKGEK